MLIFSFKMTKIKIAAMVCMCAAFAVMGFSAFYGNTDIRASSAISLKGETQEERLSYISALGYKLSDSFCEETDVLIPQEFDAVYEKYNILQQSAGFDLKNYKGKKVKKYTYNIENISENNGEKVLLNMLVYEGNIVGGDVCSTELGGFMKPLSEK